MDIGNALSEKVQQYHKQQKQDSDSTTVNYFINHGYINTTHFMNEHIFPILEKAADNGKIFTTITITNADRSAYKFITVFAVKVWGVYVELINPTMRAFVDGEASEMTLRFHWHNY